MPPPPPLNCASYPLSQHIVVATATDSVVIPTTPFLDSANHPGFPPPSYGQDITSAVGRAAPRGQSVGTTEAVLRPKMRNLVTLFAAGDSSGMAKRMFDTFLAKQTRPIIFEDTALNAAAAAHPNIQHFCSASLSSPNSKFKSAGKTRIHQALKAAGWDVTKVKAPTDLGVPAFNLGDPFVIKTKDHNNGLKVMVNGVQYVFIVATHYRYDAAGGRYCIGLKFVFLRHFWFG
jgi:hypothetical protein